MSEARDSEFVKGLLAQEPMLDRAAFQAHRQKILERLAVAEQRERRGRRIAVGALGLALAVLSCIFALLYWTGPQPPPWPDPVTYALAMAAILFPLCAVLLGAIYFARHWRELRRARDQVYRSALLDMPRQIEELRRELAELRKTAANKTQGAFTLVEMLAVGAVLAILMSLLFPALAQAKEKARGMQCANNLGQIGRALIMYEGEERGYPGAGFPLAAQLQLPNPTEDSWDMRILPFVANNTNIFNCPSLRPRRDGFFEIDAYGYNAGGTCRIHDFSQSLGLGFGQSFSNVPLRVIRSGDVRAPSEMIAVADLQMPGSVWINTITPNMPEPIGGLSTLLAGRHRGSANVVFCDGHTETAKVATWVVPLDSARRRWNNDHLPHEETWK